MSMTARPLALSGPGRGIWRRLALAAGAVALVALVVTLLVWWLAPPVTAPVKNPFNMGLREATPSGTLGAYILSVQSGFYRSLQAAVREMKQDGAAFWSLMGIGFAYG